MTIETLRGAATRRPFLVVSLWLALAAFVGVMAPDLSRLAAEGQAALLDENSESVRADAMIKQSWPDQSYESLAMVALVRPSGLTPADHTYAERLNTLFDSIDHPAEILRVLGPKSGDEVAARLLSRDGTTQLLVIQLADSFVAPRTHDAVAWLQARTGPAGVAPPSGLDLKWSGDAVIGRAYMRDVNTSLDRAALVTVLLLLGVLLAVYRSFLLAMVPLVTIGISLLISRGVLAWLVLLGWEVSPLVELFLVAILFGSGTDFCLFVSWRYAENWNAANPAGAMRVTLRRAMGALLTSAGTVIVGFLLMGTTKFKLFSSTGPSVALGLGLTVAATLTLTPALLVLLARYRPKSFAGMTGASHSLWDTLGHKAMARPALSWGLTMLVMVPLAVLGTQTDFLYDTLTEMPTGTESVRNLRFIGEKLGPGQTSPAVVVLESDGDLRTSRGLVMIDDLSRLLGRQRKLGRIEEVRSATQPLGSTDLLKDARLSSRLSKVNEGLDQMSAGAKTIHDQLEKGLATFEAAAWLERKTGLPLTKPAATTTTGAPGDPKTKGATVNGLINGSKPFLTPGLTGVLNKIEAIRGTGTPPTPPASSTGNPATAQPPASTKLVDILLDGINRTMQGVGQIADGARRAGNEVAAIRADPVGRSVLDRLLITPDTIRDHPDLNRSFDAYITKDGHRTRIDLAQSARIFSADALSQVDTIRSRLRDYVGEEEWMKIRTYVTGPNAGAADNRTLTRNDQFQTWIIVPLGVFLILMLTLRDPLACINLVATMILTYLFALGVTHLVFVTFLGAEGLDWKVPYFLFVLLVAVGVDYNVFLMSRLREESGVLGLRAGISRAIAQTGGLITSAAAITACSFASFLFSPLSSLRQLGFALVIGITIDAVLVRPLLVPCGHWLLNRRKESRRLTTLLAPTVQPVARVSD